MSVNRTKRDGTKEVPCSPHTKAVTMYNDIIGGVVVASIKKVRYQISRFVKWWHCIFYFLLDLAIINSFILWQVIKRNGSLDQLALYIALARQRRDRYSSRKRKGRPASFQANVLFRMMCVQPVWKIIFQRWFQTLDDVGNVVERDKKTRIRYMCEECDIPLCIATCFSSFHGK
ncbi:piggyBac transposable element-derived protein 4 [Trichonephila clavipes]|nr:piggyBac transposable element-derived protein 4 [Trichonephila clavipes]